MAPLVILAISMAQLVLASAQDFEILEQTFADPYAIDISEMVDFDSIPVDDSSDGITWVKVDLPDDCKTGLGNKTFIMVRKGTENKVLVYLEGGGACVSYDTCVGDNVMVSKLDLTDQDFATLSEKYRYGIFNVNDPRNPFRNWTIVFVPYSTGDIHMGNRVVKYYSADGTSNVTVYHVGYVNAVVAMRWIASQVNAEKFVLSGSSAGGFGTILHFYHLWNITHKNVTAINDAGPGTESRNPAFSMNMIDERWGAFQNYPAESLSHFQNRDGIYFVEYALEKCPGCIYGLFEDQWDIVIGYAFQGYELPEFQAKLLNVINSIKANYSSQFCSYLPLSTYHTMLAGGYNYPSGDRFYALNVDGYYVWQWLSDLLSRECKDAIDEGQRDLQIEVLDYPELASPGNTYNITVKVSNVGSNATPDPFFVLLTSDTTTPDYKVLQLAATSNETFNFTWTPPIFGSYQLNVTVDGLLSPEMETVLPFGSVVELLNFPNSEENNKVLLVASAPWQQYDGSDGSEPDDKIETTELLKAISDWLDDKITTLDLLNVINKWLES